jgi:hypothetical protein
MPEYLQRECKRHGMTQWRRENHNRWRCNACSTEARRKNRRKNKTTLINEHGGCCQICGYNRCHRALEFHHIDPKTKDFQVMLKQASMSLSRMREEAKKCVLLCANCHREVEADLVDGE